MKNIFNILKKYWREILILIMFLYIQSILSEISDNSRHAYDFSANASNYARQAMGYANEANDNASEANDNIGEIYDRVSNCEYFK
jgi:methyl-accepting chemotaxis protein